MMKYKRMTLSVPFCFECNSKISGNGSKLNPYNCECGKWIYDPKTSNYELEKYRDSIPYVDIDVNTEASSTEPE